MNFDAFFAWLAVGLILFAIPELIFPHASSKHENAFWQKVSGGQTSLHYSPQEVRTRGAIALPIGVIVIVGSLLGFWNQLIR